MKEHHRSLSLYKMLTFLIVIFTALYVFQSVFCDGGNSQLKFKTVDPNKDCTSTPNEEFDYGAESFPNYYKSGLPKCFLIKKYSDLVIESKDIIQIKIERPLTLSGSKSDKAWLVKIHFTDQAADKINLYTQAKVQSQVAVDIDENIFTIATVLVPIKGDLILTVTNNLKKVKASLAGLCSHIDVEEGIDESI